MSDSPSSASIPYPAILTAIIQRFMRLVGPAPALAVASKIPRLVIDGAGNVLDYDQEDPLNTITLLTESYAAKFGEVAVTLSRQAAQSVARGPVENLLPELSWLSSERTPTIEVLLVDDHELFRSGLAGLLASQPDMRVVGQAGSAREAVALAHDLKPSVIIMDISLPDGTGLEAARAILSEHPDIKILFLTIHDDDERLFAAIRAGAMGYLFKNSRVNDVLAQVRSVARGEAGLSPALARRILNEFSRTPVPAPASATVGTDLTPREVEIVRALAHGATNREIARQFVISEYTVKNHVRNVLSKLRLRSRREIADYARNHGLSSDETPLK